MQTNDQRPTIRPSQGPEEYPALVEIWRGAVRATHDFLEAADFDRIERRLPSDYLPAVTLLVAELDGTPVGFAGIGDGSLEMLFVADGRRGAGIGSALLAHAVARHRVTRVDVNEQNPDALAFYLRRGFVRDGRSERDGDDRPYPILHLRLADPSPN